MISHLPDSWPIAVGMAFSQRLEGSAGVVVAFCGDGATSSGTWHEAMNVASVWQTPNIFVVENNQYAYSTPTSQQFRVESLAGRASSYGIPGEQVDGNDVEAVYSAALRAIEHARRGGGPVLIEAVTMRMDGHAVHDPAKYVPERLLEEWRARDPIELFGRRIVENGWATSSFLDQLALQCREEVDAAYENALAAPLPDVNTLETGVFMAPGREPTTIPEFIA